MPIDVRDMKRRTALEFYEHEPVFKVVLDVRSPGVLLPPNWMKADPPVINLDVGEGLARPIKDLVIDEEGISGTFSFERSTFFCRVPWDAVGALAVEEKIAVGWQPLGPTGVEIKKVVSTAKEMRRARFKVIEGGGG